MMKISEMPKYEVYKDSGVEWLGDIPSSWELKPGFVAFRESKSNNKGMKENTVLSLSYGNIVVKPEEKLVGLVPESFENYQLVEPDDIIVRCTDLQNDKVSLRTGLAKNKGIITSAYLNLRAKSGFDARFLHYYLYSLDTTKVLYKFGSGLRQNLSFLDFKRLPIFEIPEDTQKLISNYLDKKTALIDEAISIKEKQINLLKERKQIIIQQAVTQGLDPNVPMKDSGVDWIGKIPAHWECLNFRYLIDVLTDYTANGSFADLAKNVTYLDEPSYSRLVRLTDLRKNLLNDGVYLSEKSHKYLSKSELLGGELLMANVGAYAGLAWIMPKIQMPATLAPNMLMLKLKIEKIRVEYVSLLLNSSKYWGYISTIAQSAAQPKLNKENVRSLPIVLPPIDEQCEIHKSIMKSSHAIEEVIREQNNQIEKLKEYKTTLINSAVTGKIKITPEMVEQ
ncbi:restriction endonuclease subunit S [Escherichia coli]|uniref:restriction endonuclease subunit S n=1 Tax=Escherichia coli TaxID=562 RepID=UPI003C77D35F